MRTYRNLCAAVLIATLISLSCAAQSSSFAAPPVYDHIVVVVEENHSAYQLGGCAYLSSLASRGASFARMYAITHPSQPNYFALFSGSTQGVTDDHVHTISAANLYDSLVAAGRSFAGYAEGLPSVGFTGASSGVYVRKHAPWVSFASVPGGLSLPFSAFPTDFSTLPTVSFVIPNVDNDMHDGTPAQADEWLKTNLDAYATWAESHNSLLIVTFDEPYDGQSPAATPIYTVFVGASVIPGTVVPYAHTLYSILRFIEDDLGLPHLGQDAAAASIKGPWG